MGLFKSLLATFIAISPLVVHAQQTPTVTPPQGYISIERSFSIAAPEYYDGTQKGFYNIDFPFTFLTFDAETSKGTFWNNGFDFQTASVPNLPANYGSKVGAGNYLGLQVDDNGQGKVIFSIWWAEASKNGPGATCTEGNEIYYQNVTPYEGIPDLKSVDTSRVWDGGRYHNCILDVTLQENVAYVLRVWELEEATKPDEPEWWGAWLINEKAGTEQFVGKIQVPGDFGWLAPNAGGFIEHFGDMPNGCDSIPTGKMTYSAARADSGNFVSDNVVASVYGLCEANVKERIKLTGCGTSKTCEIELTKPSTP